MIKCWLFFYLHSTFKVVLHCLLEWFPVAVIWSLSICPAVIWYPLQFEGTWHMRCRHARELWILKHVPCKHRCELWINTYQSSKWLKHFHVSGSWKLYLIWSTLSHLVHVSPALIAHMHTQWALTLDLGGDRWRLWICRPRLRRGASGSMFGTRTVCGQSGAGTVLPTDRVQRKASKHLRLTFRQWGWPWSAVSLRQLHSSAEWYEHAWMFEAVGGIEIFHLSRCRLKTFTFDTFDPSSLQVLAATQ